jgi:hypothetical protein
MMLVAIASGSAVKGALVMFAFVLGTTPVFFILGLLATRLSAAMHGAFRTLAAATVALLALLSIVTGYRLLPIAGGASPLSVTSSRREASQPAPSGQGLAAYGSQTSKLGAPRSTSKECMLLRVSLSQAERWPTLAKTV